MAEGSGGVRGSSSKPPSSLLATRSTIMYIFGMNPPEPAVRAEVWLSHSGLSGLGAPQPPGLGHKHLRS
jgi:hypothetical protein